MDRYDRAVEILTACPTRYEGDVTKTRRHNLNAAWGSPRKHPAGCLFAFLGGDPVFSNEYCCPTLWKGRATPFAAPMSEAVCVRIDESPLIPTSIQRLFDLPAAQFRAALGEFAEVQRLADAEDPGRDWSAFDARFPG